jgi:hypothetical protein
MEITKTDLTKAHDLQLTEKQLNIMLKKTPTKYVRERPAKGGGKWKYVSVGYITKALNLMFGWDWSFDILKEEVFIEAGEVVVKGQLTVRVGDKYITKTQYGNKDIMFRKGTQKPLSIGNDMKSAASDSLKKCASMIGLAQDIYAPEEFTETQVHEAEPMVNLGDLLAGCKEKDDYKMVWESLEEEDQRKYRDIFERLINSFDNE